MTIDWLENAHVSIDQLFIDHARRHKEQNPCVTCGETDPDKLTFHHRDPKQKVRCIGQYRAWDSFAEFVAEIDKCDILCVDCHRKVHQPGKTNA